MFVALLCSLAVLGATARAPTTALPAHDDGRIGGDRRARSGDWTQAYAQAGQSKDPLALKIVRWLDYSRGTAGGRFAEIAAFIDQNPDWPAQKKLRRRAEGERRRRRRCRRRVVQAPPADQRRRQGARRRDR